MWLAPVCMHLAPDKHTRHSTAAMHCWSSQLGLCLTQACAEGVGVCEPHAASMRAVIQTHTQLWCVAGLLLAYGMCHQVLSVLCEVVLNSLALSTGQAPRGGPKLGRYTICTEYHMAGCSITCGWPALPVSVFSGGCARHTALTHHTGVAVRVPLLLLQVCTLTSHAVITQGRVLCTACCRHVSCIFGQQQLASIHLMRLA
jgi:hypothetical protein